MPPDRSPPSWVKWLKKDELELHESVKLYFGKEFIFMLLQRLATERMKNGS